LQQFQTEISQQIKRLKDKTKKKKKKKEKRYRGIQGTGYGSGAQSPASH
jgi:hypothetical protein